MIAFSKLEEFIDLIPLPVLVITMDEMCIDSYNKSFSDWTGIEMNGFLKKHVSHLNIWSTPDCCLNFIMTLDDHHETFTSEYKLIAGDGKIHICNLVSRVYELDDLKYLMILIEDITKLKQIEKEKEKLYCEAQLTISQMMGDVEFLTNLIIKERMKNKYISLKDINSNFPIEESRDGKKHIKVNDCLITLNDKEIGIIKKIVEGKNTSEIASELYLAEGSIRNIITEIISKLMLKDKTQLAVFALKHGIV